MDAFQLCLNGRGDDLAAALDVDPTLLDRPQQGGLYDSRTLLHCAASKGHALVVQMLLSRGAPREAVDKRGQTALALAQKLGHHEIEQLLLGAQDAGRAEAPRRAEDGEGEQRLRANDRMGAEKRGRAEEEEEAPEKQRRIAGSLETHTTAPLPVSEPRPLAREGTGKRRLSPLSDHATDSPAAKRATGSIAHEFPPGMDPFQLCLNGKTAELAVMLDVDPGLVHRTQEGGLYDSRTLLHCAAAKGRAELVALLLERGADAAAVEKRGHTAASLARKLGHISVVQLLERGAPAEGLTSKLRPSALAFTPRQPPWSSSKVSERQAALPAAAAVASRVLESSSPVTLARFDSADYAMSREAKKKWSARPPPAAHAAPCDSVAPAASAPEAPPAAHPDSMAAVESATDVRVHVHECTAADRPPFASPAGALTLSRVVHKAETTSMDDVIEALRKEHCLTAIREPKDASGQLVPGATDVFTAWLNHADATDGSFDSDLHVWCLVDRPGPDGDHNTIYDILSEEADSLDDSS